MAVIDDAKTLGRARLDFADERDIETWRKMTGTAARSTR